MDPGQLRFVVITKNSARWFGTILDRYEAIGISPFVIVDGSSDEGTSQLLAARRIGHATVSAEFPRVEAMMKFIPDHVPSPWVFRLDDDELPSVALCDWLEARLDSFGQDVVGFQRRWIRRAADGSCEYSRHPMLLSRLRVMDVQWRLFRPSAVRYRPDIHTPGFHVPRGSPVAPGSAYIAHLAWIVRSADERRRQIEEYDRQEPDAGSRFRDVRTWEDASPAAHDFVSLETDEFDGTAAVLADTNR